MESIEQMIKRLCPKGVEYVKLGDLFELRNGYTPSKGNVDFWTDGTIPWFRMEDIRANGRILNDSIQHITPSAIKGKGLFPAGSFILATTATIGEHALLTTDSLANQRFTNLSVRKTYQKDVNVKFLYHYMFIIDEWCKKNVNSSSFASVDMNKLKEYMIPIPPLEIQSRIVEVLDKMTTLTAELEAELEARKQQYEYYRNKLLSYNEIGMCNRQVAWKRLGDILYSIRTGLNPRKFFSLNTPDATNFYVTIKEFKGGNLVFGNNTDMINDEAMRLCNNRSHLEEGDLLFSSTGTIGEVLIVKETPRNWNIKEGVYALKPKSEEIKVEYLKHIMQNSSVKAKLESISEGGTVKSISMKKLADFVIPVPSMQEQQRIVSILDRFEALTTDLQSGLPAEIEARRQQYEYYRNKLLTFEAV